MAEQIAQIFQQMQRQNDLLEQRLTQQAADTAQQLANQQQQMQSQLSDLREKVSVLTAVR